MPSTRQSYLHSINGNDPSSSSAPSASSAPATPSSSSTAKPAAQPSSDPPSTRHPLHQQWEFAAVWQFLLQFHKGLKSPYYDDIEQFAIDLSSPTGTQLLHDVQIGLLKNVSSQRGLTIDMFDDYTRRQYYAKKPEANPFGDGTVPTSFYSLLPEERVRVLHQLSMWIISKPEIFRDKVETHRFADQLDWRIDPIGWDAKGTPYYQLDNGYLYCRTEPPPPVYQKWKSRKHAAGRSTKRRRVLDDDDETNGEDNAAPMNENDTYLSQIEWKCLCTNLEEYRALVAKFEKSKNPDEKELRKVIVEDILPAFEKEEQKRKRKLLEEEKEQARLQMLSGRKRSARVDERMARLREAQEQEHALRSQREEHEQLRREEERKQKEEEARIAKLEEREKRLQDRELRAKQRAEEKARLLDPDATESDDSNTHGSRKSSRQIIKRKAELDIEDKDWVFDCICGVHGVNYDDGTFSIACDKCSVWQHTACLNLPVSAAQEEEFICDRCRDKQNAKMSTPIKIKLRLTRPTSSEEEGEGKGTRQNDLKGVSDSTSTKPENAPNGNALPSTTTTDQHAHPVEPSRQSCAQEPAQESSHELPQLAIIYPAGGSKPVSHSPLQTTSSAAIPQPSPSKLSQSDARVDGTIQQSPTS
ncbi:hypothetical protein TWF696_008165 [Orbilia brochopaga]|uniref:Zinc finger PHD-type domain-containing protein n=1 Tax=Orbilia brochopaga TaxID=3140254 RepID=A0AAV9UM85_9PEZI